MSCSQCVGLERQFSDPVARRDLRRYKKRGPPASTRLLLDGITALGVSDKSFLDVGGGIGAIQHELMAAGASGGTHADASSAYLEASRAEAAARGYDDRILYIEGDFVEMQNDVPSADVVTLDRVVCCYPDMPALIDAAASHADRALGLVYPRSRRLIRFGIRVINWVQGIRRHPFRVFLHPPADVEAQVARRGLDKRSHTETFLWRITVFTRAKPNQAHGD
jgi:magnesium-protoporphyrin O-methyltransferase